MRPSVTELRKIRYEIDLTDPPYTNAAPTPRTRRLVPSDRDELGVLILDAYLGTIDYEGETIVEANEAIDDWLDSGPLLEHSCAAVIDDEIVSAVLVTTYDEHPFISIVMTHPDHKGEGYATAAVASTLTSLRSEDHAKVILFITEGNTASEALFATLGAKPVEEN